MASLPSLPDSVKSAPPSPPCSAMTSGLMRALFLAVALLCLARAAAALTARRMPERAFRSAFGTPVSLKIRLND